MNGISLLGLIACDGVPLSAAVSGPEEGHVVVLLHGFPDDRHVWDELTLRLDGRFRTIAYDARGAGASGAPRYRSGYLLHRLVDDLETVLDGCEATAPVHLVGHDWGSIVGWEAVCEPRLAGRIATFTSISGPDARMTATWLRHGGAAARRQILRSWYVGAFQLPGSAALVGALLGPDARRGVELYRANLRTARPNPVDRRPHAPVLLLVPTEDPFVTEELAIGAPAPFTEDLTTERLVGGHWIIRTHPQQVAEAITAMIERHSREPMPSPRRAPAERPPGRV